MLEAWKGVGKTVFPAVHLTNSFLYKFFPPKCTHIQLRFLVNDRSWDARIVIEELSSLRSLLRFYWVKYPENRGAVVILGETLPLLS